MLNLGTQDREASQGAEGAQPTLPGLSALTLVRCQACKEGLKESGGGGRTSHIDGEGVDILEDGAKGWPEAGGKEDAGARFYARRVERAGGLCLETGVWLAMSTLWMGPNSDA